MQVLQCTHRCTYGAVSGMCGGVGGLTVVDGVMGCIVVYDSLQSES